MKSSQTRLHAWSEPDDYIRARRSTLPPEAGRISLAAVVVMWLCFVVGLFVAATPRSPLLALAIAAGALLVAVAIAWLFARLDFNFRQRVILDRRHLFINDTYHALDTIRSVVVGSQTIGSGSFPVLLVRMRNAVHYVIGRDGSVPDEVLEASFRELGIKVED